MKHTARVGLGIGLGYVLGRQRKLLRTALLLGAAAAAGRLPAIRGGAVARRDGSAQSHVPNAVGRLGEAGIAAARSAVSRPVTRLGDRLNATAETLRPAGTHDGAADSPDQSETDERDRQTVPAGKRGDR